MRATHVEAPALRWDEEDETLPPEPAYPSGADESELSHDLDEGVALEEDAPEPVQRELTEDDLTPQGKLRSNVTEADDFDLQRPLRGRAQALARHRQGRPWPRGADRPPAGRGARPLRRRVKVVGTITGPHITRYEVRLAPGVKMSKVSLAEGRPGLRAGRDRRAHPRADPRQAGRRRRGAQPRPQDGPPGRRLPGRPEGLVAAHGLARQGHRGQGDRHRPGQAAAHPGRGHDRLGQVGLRQRDAVVDPARATPNDVRWC